MNDFDTPISLSREEIIARRAASKERKKEIKLKGIQKKSGAKTVLPPPDAVMQFKGEYFFLCNFHRSPIIYDGMEYPSSEHAYQAAKFENAETKKTIASMPTPGAARWCAHNTSPVSVDWEERKVEVMREVVFAKFTQHPKLRERLLATGEAHLEEGNRHGDTFWGTVDGVGENMLGKILMEIRKQFRCNSSLAASSGLFVVTSDGQKDVK